MPSVSETPTRISPVSSLASRYISRRSSESQSVITTRRFSSSSASRSGSNVPSINEASDGGSACARRSVRAVSIINATVSARSPTSEKHSSAIHPGTCARSQPHTASSRGAINRFSLRPVRKKGQTMMRVAPRWTHLPYAVLIDGSASSMCAGSTMS